MSSRESYYTLLRQIGALALDQQIKDYADSIYEKALMESVRTVGTSDYSGYLIGLHDNEQGKATRVWALDMDELDVIMDRSDE